MKKELNFEQESPRTEEIPEVSYDDFEVYAEYTDSEGISSEEFAGEISIRTGLLNGPSSLEIDGVQYLAQK